MTIYELQAFSDNNVARTEVNLPPNDAPSFYPDPRYGDPNAIDILSVVWSFDGDVYVLDHRNGIHKVHQTPRFWDYSLDFSYFLIILLS